MNYKDNLDYKILHVHFVVSSCRLDKSNLCCNGLYKLTMFVFGDRRLPIDEWKQRTTSDQKVVILVAHTIPETSTSVHQPGNCM